MKGVKIFLANGFEDVEGLAVNDVLRRGGVESQLVAVDEEAWAETSHGVGVNTDYCFSDIDTSHADTTAEDFMIFPGGMPGSKALAECEPLIKLMKGHYAAGGSLAAICAAPGLVLSQLDDWAGREFTCFEGFQDALIAKGGIYLPEKPTVRSERIITGRSAGNAVIFGIKILEAIKGPETAAEVYNAMFLRTDYSEFINR